MGYGRHVLRRRLKNNYWEALSKYVILRSKVAIRTKLYDPVLEPDSNAQPSHAASNGPLGNQMGLSRKHVLRLLKVRSAML